MDKFSTQICSLFVPVNLPFTSWSMHFYGFFFLWFISFSCVASWPVFYSSCPVTELLKGEPHSLLRVKLWARLQEPARECVICPLVLGPTAALCPVKTLWHWGVSLRNWKVTEPGCWLNTAEQKRLSHAQPPGTALLLSAGGLPGLLAVSKVLCTAHYHNSGGRLWDPEY